MAIYNNSPEVQTLFSAPVKVKEGKNGLLLYIHIPFCKQKCNYCSFFSQVVSAKYYTLYIDTLCKEISLWGERLERPLVETIFFGGGTPSLLDLGQMERILTQISYSFSLATKKEISMEVNPESAQNKMYYRGLHSLGINRISFGVQTFSASMLQVLGRLHTVEQVVHAYESARSAGYNNISIDLMMGLPGQKLRDWLYDIDQVFTLNPEHVSAYGLTIEKDTPFEKMLEHGKIIMPKEREQSQMFLHGIQRLEEYGYIQYEISNFAKIGKHCQHNSGYWAGRDYLGLGASAVSTIGKRRFRAPSDIGAYATAVENNTIGENFEILTKEAQDKEWAMLHMRTVKGLSLLEYEKRMGKKLLEEKDKFIQGLYGKNFIRVINKHLCLTKKGMLVSNSIIESLFF